MAARDAAQVRHQVVRTPFERGPDDNEGVLLITIAGEEHLRQISAVRQLRNLLLRPFDAY